MTGIHEIHGIFQKKEREMKEWIAHYKEPLNDPLYASVDVRNAGFKFSPVDTNIYPGGWNNICTKSLRLGAEKLKKYIERVKPGTTKILILPEHHTRNSYYLSNILQLETMVQLAGFEVRIGNFNPENAENVLALETSDGKIVTEHKVTREGNKLIVEDFDADFYLLNNDLSGGIPEVLKGLDNPLVPTPLGGWHSRIKSDHFHYYAILATMFAKEFDFDPWLIMPYFDHEEEVDLTNEESLKQLAQKTDALLEKIALKYKEYGITDKPFVFLKNESGTYGMGITTVESGEEILKFNRDERKKMSTGKDKVKITALILQEGVPTVEKLNKKITEPVSYMVDNEVVGGFFRVHGERGERENLNMPGMTFTKMCIHDIHDYTNDFDGTMGVKDMLPMYQIIAELASIATGYELIGLQNQV